MCFIDKSQVLLPTSQRLFLHRPTSHCYTCPFSETPLCLLDNSSQALGILMSESAITQFVPIIQDTQKEDHTCTYCGYDSFCLDKRCILRLPLSIYTIIASCCVLHYLEKHEESKESLSDALRTKKLATKTSYWGERETQSIVIYLEVMGITLEEGAPKSHNIRVVIKGLRNKILY